MLFTCSPYYTALLIIVLSQSSAVHLTRVAVRVAVRSGAVWVQSSLVLCCARFNEIKKPDG